MSNIERNFTPFDYGLWNTMITHYYPPGNDEDEEEEDVEGEEEAVSDPAPAIGKAKASPVTAVKRLILMSDERCTKHLKSTIKTYLP